METDEIGPSLLAAFARVPDVRSRHGRRYPLPALLTLATAAMLGRVHGLDTPYTDLTPLTPARSSGLSTGEGLLWQIRDERVQLVHNKKTHTTDEVVVDTGVPDKRLLVVEPEFARVLAVMYRDGNTLSTTLRGLYDSPPEEQSSPKNNPVVATAPHVGVIGQITPGELHRKLHDVELFNGFVNRYLWTVTHRVKSRPEPPDYSDKVKEHARWWSDAVRRAKNTIRRMHRDHRATAQWDTEYELLRVGGRDGLPGREGLARDVCSRAHVMVLRMALIFAAMEGTDTITVAHQDAALAVWDWCERCAAYLFSDVAGDPVENVIADALRARGKLSRADVRNLFSRHQPSAAIQVALDSLLKAGKVRTFQEQTGGRAVEWWEWVAA